MKPIRFSNHAREQADLRGATTDEIIDAIRMGTWQSALRGKFESKKRFGFNQISPINQKHYRFKTVEAIFADEPEVIGVVTVKVYYSNEE